MACCILAAFVIGQCALVWRWLETRCGRSPRPPAALWSAGADRVSDTPPRASRWPWQRPALAWRTGVGIVLLTIGAVVTASLADAGGGAALPLRHIAPAAAWCIGDLRGR